MRSSRFHAFAIAISLAMLTVLPTGCGGGDRGPGIEDMPLYPNDVEGESMQASAGMGGGSLLQYTTTDSFDDVLDFYVAELAQYDPQEVSHESELGRQTALSIPKKKGMITIAIQEFTAEGTVNITYMVVGG